MVRHLEQMSLPRCSTSGPPPQTGHAGRVGSRSSGRSSPRSTPGSPRGFIGILPLSEIAKTLDENGDTGPALYSAPGQRKQIVGWAPPTDARLRDQRRLAMPTLQRRVRPARSINREATVRQAGAAMARPWTLLAQHRLSPRRRGRDVFVVAQDQLGNDLPLLRGM